MGSIALGALGSQKSPDPGTLYWHDRLCYNYKGQAQERASVFQSFILKNSSYMACDTP